MIEVDNIRFKAERIDSINSLRAFVSKRTEDKLQDKLKSIPADWGGWFGLVQVLWGEITELYDYRTFFTDSREYASLLEQTMVVAYLENQRTGDPAYMFMSRSLDAVHGTTKAVWGTRQRMIRFPKSAT